MTQQQGKIFTYVHHTGKLMGWVELTCQTDFAERTDLFNTAGKDLAMHVATTGSEDVTGLLMDDWVMGDGLSVQDVINNLKKELGEDVQIKRFFRTNFGEE